MHKLVGKESLTGRVDAVVHNEEVSALDRRMAGKNWNQFVSCIISAQKHVLETKYLSRSHRDELEGQLALASYDLGRDDGSGLSVVDIYMNGFEIVTGDSKDEYERNFRQTSGRQAKLVRAVDCDIHAVPLLETDDPRRVESLGLEIVGIHSGDSDMFGDYARMHVPAMQLAKRK